MSNKSNIFFKGIIDVSPLMIPVVPFGIIFGVLAIDLGLSPLTTMDMSIIIFGGASQIVFLQLWFICLKTVFKGFQKKYSFHIFMFCFIFCLNMGKSILNMFLFKNVICVPLEEGTLDMSDELVS